MHRSVDSGGQDETGTVQRRKDGGPTDAGPPYGERSFISIAPSSYSVSEISTEGRMVATVARTSWTRCFLNDSTRFSSAGAP